MRIFVLLLGAGIAITAAGFFATAQDELIIAKTAQGFLPETVVIDRGTVVRFVNDTDRDIWPASDSHPTHGMYPEFDPKAPIPPGDHWSFSFDAPGVWEFHDHLDSLHTGRIVVRGEPGETTASCLEKRKWELLVPECWEAEMADALQEGGLTRAFARVTELYESESMFRKNCHDVMHILGAAAYREFKASQEVAAHPETAYCGYGFFHGFIETMLIEDGFGDLDAAKEYCELVRTADSSADGPCYHGIGHAIFDTLPGSLWGDVNGMTDEALGFCERALSGDHALQNCASGVFNSLANAMSADDYRLSFKGFVPAALCSTQDPLYMKYCYGETGIGYIRQERMNRTEAAAWIREQEESVRDFLFFVYFSDETKQSMDHFSPETLAASCMDLSVAEDTESCIEGTIQGIREQTKREIAHMLAFPFCAEFDSPLREYCIADMFTKTDYTLWESPSFQDACRAAAAGNEGLCAR